MSRAEAFRLPFGPSFGGELNGLINRPDASGPPPSKPRAVVVVCHGFKGFMEWGFFGPLAELLSERGFVVVRFNYSGSGMQPGEERVGDLDAFRQNTFSLERDETLHVLDSLESLVGEPVDIRRVGLLGHSRGGGAAVLAAAERVDPSLGALVTWAAVSTYQRYAKHAEAWRAAGVLPVVNGRTGQELELGVELLEDLEQNTEELDLQRAAGRVKAPWLVVHGKEDETVPLEEARDLDRWAGGEHRLEWVPGGHTFGAKHPFAGPTPELIQAMNATQIWLRRHLA